MGLQVGSHSKLELQSRTSCLRSFNIRLIFALLRRDGRKKAIDVILKEFEKNQKERYSLTVAYFWIQARDLLGIRFVMLPDLSQMVDFCLARTASDPKHKGTPALTSFPAFLSANPELAKPVRLIFKRVL